MIDVQKLPDHRNIEIQDVGIKNFHLPLLIREKNGGYQAVLGQISLSANLTPKFKGTHLSRFVEILNPLREKVISSAEIKDLLEKTCKELKATNAALEIRFKYFVEKKAPVSRKTSVLDYDCTFYGVLKENEHQFILKVKVPVMNLCPCSKEISKWGAHNQRGYITVRISYQGEIFWIEDLVALIEEQASAPIFPLLKREDEKYITEYSYSNPKFVEDVLRDVVLALRNIPSINFLQVLVEDIESIHNHTAFAGQIESR